MEEDKILPQTDLFFWKKFQKFSTIQLNEVYKLATTCLATRNSEKKAAFESAIILLFKKVWVELSRQKVVAQNVKQGLP